MAEQLVFDNTVDALFRRALGGRLSEAAKTRIREAGIDLSGKLVPAYPREVYYRALHLAAEDLFPGAAVEKSMLSLGALFIEGFQETVLGRAVILACKVLGTKKTLQRMGRNFASSNNYMKTELVEHGPQDFELRLSETSGVPHYFQGVLQRALTLTGARGLRIELMATDGHACSFRLRWEP